MTAYLESSVVLRHILLGEDAIRHALEFPDIVSSELTEIECRRVLHRYRLQGELSDEGMGTARERLDDVLRGISLLELSRPIKQRAMDPFPVTVRTLDALHIATALAVSETTDGLSIFSHDHRLNTCARSLGLRAALA